MQSFGRAPDEAVENSYQQIRARAVEMWGEDRAEAMDETLRRTASAVARMHDLKFDTGDAPGFFLAEFTPESENPSEGGGNV